MACQAASLIILLCFQPCMCGLPQTVPRRPNYDEEVEAMDEEEFSSMIDVTIDKDEIVIEVSAAANKQVSDSQEANQDRSWVSSIGRILHACAPRNCNFCVFNTCPNLTNWHAAAILVLVFGIIDNEVAGQ
ncbi:uncharacterized protein LOC136039531 isoform X2 [Artemia franciscana]|uniref:uncharacterized protein LOC136039531 isoform X2 n=1 Tax=Artemia franciscana TaxID=6661 RepID=UPI0032DBB9BB